MFDAKTCSVRRFYTLLIPAVIPGSKIFAVIPRSEATRNLGFSPVEREPRSLTLLDFITTTAP